MNKLSYVPRIDIGALRGNNEAAKLNVAQKIDAVNRGGSGFFYASNHGINVEKLAKTTAMMHQKVSSREKYDLAINAYNPQNNRSRAGYYLSIQGRKAPESFCYLNPNFTSDHPSIIAKIPMHEVNVWPEPKDGIDWQAFYEDYYWEIFKFSQMLLRGFALALGEEEDFFSNYFMPEDTLSAVSLIRYPYLKHYPPLKKAKDGTLLSFGDHLDVSLITVLFQTPVQNLQVEISGDYYDTYTSGQDFLINCGTYMDHLTGGMYPARRHRVVFVNKERLSIPFFVNLGSKDAPKIYGADAVGKTVDRIEYGEYLQRGLCELIKSNGQT